MSTLCSNGQIPEVVLVTTAIDDTEWRHCEKETAVDFGRDVRKLFRKDKVILVGTKYDLVPRDRSLCDNIIQSMPSEFAYFHDLKFCAVSTVTGEGINDLKTEICMSVSTLSNSVAKIRIHGQAEWYTHVIKAYHCSGCQISSILFLIVSSMSSHMPSHFRYLPT